LLYGSDKEKRSTFDISISKKWIDRVTLSPWIVSALAEDLKKTIRSIPGCANLKIARSTLISNEQWKKAGENVRDPADTWIKH
jgi:hypothetical protein